jgi:hypothetical protein
VSYIYLTATLNAATRGAELALGEVPGRIYIVELTGPIEDDPNLTDKKFPDNPASHMLTKSASGLWLGHGLAGSLPGGDKSHDGKPRAI